MASELASILGKPALLSILVLCFGVTGVTGFNFYETLALTSDPGARPDSFTETEFRVYAEAQARVTDRLEAGIKELVEADRAILAILADKPPPALVEKVITIGANQVNIQKVLAEMNIAQRAILASLARLEAARWAGPRTGIDDGH